MSPHVWCSVPAALYAGMTSTTLPRGGRRRSCCGSEACDTGGRSVSMGRPDPSPNAGDRPGPVTGRWRPAGSRYRSLATGEVSLPLLDVGGEPFLRVLALEQELLQLALHGQRRLERDLRAALHRALDAAHGLRRLVRRAELLGVLLHLVHELLRARGLPDLVHEPELLRLLEAEDVAGDHELDGLALVDEPRHALRAARAREHAERHLGQAHLARTLAGDAQVGRH